MSSPSLSVKGLSLDELTYDPTSVVPYEGEQIVMISCDEIVRVNIETTTHGNGLLTLTQDGQPTLTIPIYDCCEEDDQYYVFDGDMLNYEFVDLDGDGILELRVTGTLIFRNDETMLQTWPIEDTYKYNRGEHKWSLHHSNGPTQWVEQLKEQMAWLVPLPSEF